VKETLALFAAALVSACGGASPSPPSYPDPGEPNGTFVTATPIVPGTPIVATISSAADLDFFAFAVPPGGATVRFRTFDEGGTSCDLVNGTVDTFLDVYDPSKARVAWSDDSGINLCEDFALGLPEGTSYVRVSTYPGYGPFVYTLSVDVP